MSEDFSFIIATRNPRTKKLILIQGDDGDVAEFSCEAAAISAADDTTVCKAWGYEIIEIGAPAQS